jgi:hypothetical protein
MLLLATWLLASHMLWWRVRLASHMMWWVLALHTLQSAVALAHMSSVALS